MPHKKIHRLLWLVALLSVFLLNVVAVQAEPILLRFSHVVGENTPKGQGAILFKQLVEQRLPGKVYVEIYPRSLKYTDDQALLGLLFGDLEMAAPSFPKFFKYSKDIRIFDLPFLFENVDEVHRFQQSAAGQKLLTTMEPVGIKGLTYWDNGMRVISANKPVRHPGDLKGLTFRIEPSHIFYKQYGQLGAVAIPMPFKQLRDALRINLIDGYENAWSNIYAGNFHQYRRNFIEVGHSYLGYMVVTSTKFWNNLPEPIRKELEQILDEVTAKVNRLALEKTISDRKMVQAMEGVNVIRLTDEEKQEWKNALQPVRDEFEPTISPELLQAAKQGKQ